MIFMICVQLLDVGISTCLSSRYNMAQAAETNEILEFTSSNRWRSTQLFYMAAPVQLYSIICGVREFIRWRYYAIDISWWAGGDRGNMAISLVKWWTLLLVVGPVPAWVCYILYARQWSNTWAGCMIVTI